MAIKSNETKRKDRISKERLQEILDLPYSKGVKDLYDIMFKGYEADSDYNAQHLRENVERNVALVVQIKMRSNRKLNKNKRRQRR